MKIGVISDTHINHSAASLPNKVHEAFAGVDMIIHAGDILVQEVIIELETIAPVCAVAGNNDSYEMFHKYGKSKIIEANGKRIGITHGAGRGRTYMNAYSEFYDQKLDCIVYGHSHVPYNAVIDDILFFNPGSPTNKRHQPQYSVGILYVQEDIDGVIIYFDK